jgi:hypothetical protein
MSEHTPAVIDDARPHYQDINAPVVILLTVVTAILTYSSIAFVQGYYFQWDKARVERQSADSVSTSTAYLMEERQMLSEGSVERKIQPIGESMSKMVGEWGSKAAD